MESSVNIITEADETEVLLNRYKAIRNTSLSLCLHLAPEDYVVQSMPDVSPVKWHLAHTTWFFERFVLEPYDKGYSRFDDQYHYLFNSYYYTAGQMHPRPQRGLLTRPLVEDIRRYRRHVDDAIIGLLNEIRDSAGIITTIEIGLNHEQQHQELMLTDIKHVFSCNPMMLVVNPDVLTSPAVSATSHRFIAGGHGVQEFGASGQGFCFDNELPQHPALLHEHSIGSRLITNSEYLDFIRDGGYQTCELWLSDGWAVVQERGWNRPLYWSEDKQSEFTLGGQRALDPAAPVAHVSLYEADAFARWSGARLPTEFEWEAAASKVGVNGNFMESKYWHPVASEHNQFFGDVWEWTSSPYAAYPGFKPLDGSLGEYNGKFMCNQLTVRGGSCITAADHIRVSYRSFFYPDARWQFLGIRLAKDGMP